MSDTVDKPTIGGVPGNGLLQQAMRAVGKHRSLLKDPGAIELSKGKPAANSGMDTNTPTASNPSTITQLTPAESASSLAQARAKQKAKVDAAKAAQNTANARKVGTTY